MWGQGGLHSIGEAEVEGLNLKPAEAMERKKVREGMEGNKGYEDVRDDLLLILVLLNQAGRLLTMHPAHW